MSELKRTTQEHTSQKQGAQRKKEPSQKAGPSAAKLSRPESEIGPEDILQAQREVGNIAVQRKLDSGGPAGGNQTEGYLSDEISGQIQQKRGSGSPLPAKIAKNIGTQLGHDFSDVRIHTDGQSDKLARSVSARAFTVGRDIFFKGGVFDPASEKGRETIAHELTHVVHQSGSKAQSGKLKLGAPDTAMEKEADKTGKSLAAKANIGGAASGAIQRSGAEEEELLQGQRESVVQRSGSEEEELLQGQRESVVQRSGSEEEELLQGQRESVVQRSGSEDEELLQGQRESVVQRSGSEDEELLQGQREPVVQRDLAEELEKERVRRLQGGGRKKRNEQIEKLEESHEKIALDPKTIKTAQVQHGQSQQKAEALTKHAKEMGIGGKKNLSNLEKLESKRAEKDKEARTSMFNQEKEERHTKSRNSLMETIKNKNSSPEDIKSAKEQLDMMHKRGKWDTFKSFFTPGATTKSYSEQATEQRRSALKESAKSGNKEDFKKFKAEEEEADKNSTSTKVLGALGTGAKKVGGMLGGLLGGVLKTQMGNAKEHFFGKSEEKDEDKEEKGSSKKGESSAGAGMGAMLEKFGDLVKQNQELKARLAKYEKAE